MVDELIGQKNERTRRCKANTLFTLLRIIFFKKKKININETTRF